jgi:hypothetical protein
MLQVQNHQREINEVKCVSKSEKQQTRAKKKKRVKGKDKYLKAIV